MDKPTTPQEALAQIAMTYLGTEEVGQNDGPQVEEFQKAVPGARPEHQPWCMDFVQYCVLKVESQYGWKATVFRSQSVLDVWKHAPLWVRASTPARGWVAIWQRVGSWEGHCGIVLSLGADGRSFETIEGNTSAGKAVEREGNGVYEKLRLLAARQTMTIGAMKLLGFVDAFR